MKDQVCAMPDGPQAYPSMPHCFILLLKWTRVVSLTPSPTGQDPQAIMEDLCGIVRERDSDGRHAPRAVSATYVAVGEQACRYAIALRLSEDDSAMPLTLTIGVVSLPRAAGLPLAVLVSFAYNFQSIEAIAGALRGHGIADPFEGGEELKRIFGTLVGLGHDRIHTSTYGDLGRRAAYDATERLVFRTFRQFPDARIDMRLLQGDIFREMRLWELSMRSCEEALALCMVLVAENQDSAEAHAKTGLALAGLGRHEEALAAYAKAIELEPERAVTHLGRAQTLASMGRTGEALAAYDRTVELAPSLAEAHLRLGRLLARMAATGRRWHRATGLAGVDERPIAGHVVVELLGVAKYGRGAPA